ncbi:palmitoyltransferase ZDHHC11-like isoform X2 [Mirounga angustirostris]|uniref:palmitoyltransferase ZDHHC11-like isoform X2 n=1 Tax=Mirounga angustirostris TaxID=9716 RepID=UPI0023E3758E|nr:palmitoyltransferase ZDHHC11-like isoform X2 [Mirounga angustirostris]
MPVLGSWRCLSWVLGPVGLTPSKSVASLLWPGQMQDSPGPWRVPPAIRLQSWAALGSPCHAGCRRGPHTACPPPPILQMDLCSRSWRRVVPEAGGKWASPPRLSRVNGWSRPLHSFQAVAWVTLLIMAIATFGIFIPFLPRNWKYIAYSVNGGLFFLHFLVHLIAVSIDPAEANVRLKKNYSKPLPTFDRSRHAHVIQNQYCHLCEVTVSSKAKHCSACNKCVSGFDHHCKWLNNCVGSRNYWYFFLSVASASAGLLCLIIILLYIFIQFFIDQEELRTHPYYEKVSNKNTWMLFLPLFPVKAKTLVVLGIGVFVLLLDIVSLLLLGHLLIFHLYLMAKKLSTFDYMTQGRQQQTPKASAEKEELSFQIEFPQQAGDDQSSSVHREKHKEPQPLRKCPSLCSTTAVHPESSLMLVRTDGDQSSSAQRVTSKELLLPDMPSFQLSATMYPENSWLTDTGSKLTSSAPGPRRKVLLSRSESSSLRSTTTASPESALSLQVSKDQQQETRQPMRGDGGISLMEKTVCGHSHPLLSSGSRSPQGRGAKAPTPEPPSFRIPSQESDLENLMPLYRLPCSHQNVLSREGARCGGQQSPAGAPATSSHEPRGEQAVQGSCHLQDGQPPGATPEVAQASVAPFGQAEGPPAARGETGVRLCLPGEARDPDA